MGLYREIELNSGVVVSYHRVVSVNTVTNVQDTVEVASYTSQAKREDSRNPESDVFVSTSFFAAPYGICPTIQSAYEWLKVSVPEFEDAIDAE